MDIRSEDHNTAVGVEANQVPSRSEGSQRYHGLDALRAWAMSMGIVLHAAWIMTPGETGAPMTDASASYLLEYLLLSIHTFRMQLFFVLAGLFACLVLSKRGTWSFARNRFLRIVIPLVVFTVILSPLMIYQYTAAGIQSGAIQGDMTPAKAVWDYLGSIGPSNVFLIHLWFIYYLSLTIIIVVALRSLVAWFDRNGGLRQRLTKSFGHILTSRWSAVYLAALTGPLLFFMKVNWGIEIDGLSLKPHWLGLFSYVLYFSCGWLMFRHIDSLPCMVRNWPWQLALGIVLTLPYYFYAKYTFEHGYTTWDYPQLAVEDFYFVDEQPDYSAFRSMLLESAPDSVPGLLLSALPEPNRKFLRQQQAVTQNQLTGLLASINRDVFPSAALFDTVRVDKDTLNVEAREILAKPAELRSENEAKLLNRGIIESAFTGVIYTEDIHRPFYYPMRAAYGFGYSLITWLLIFGCIGFAQHFFHGASPFWRYFSDSSYWFYLAHLPIQFQILLWIGSEPWHWLAKFSVYVFGTTAVLLFTYHFFVRPSWLGWMLNGRTYPIFTHNNKVEAGQAGNELVAVK